MKQTRSAIWRANPISCVAMTIVMPESASVGIERARDSSRPLLQGVDRVNNNFD